MTTPSNNSGSTVNYEVKNQFNETSATPYEKDFLSLLNQQDFSDITLIVEDKPIYCHQVILAQRSGYFEATFNNSFSEKEQRVATYKDVNYDMFMIFLKQLYSDSVRVETKHIYDLLSVSFFTFLTIFVAC